MIHFSQLRERAYKCYNYTALNLSAGILISNPRTPGHLAFTTKFKITSGTSSSEREYIYIYIYIYDCVCVCVCACVCEDVFYITNCIKLRDIEFLNPS
jgi:hypothetical protein